MNQLTTGLGANGPQLFIMGPAPFEIITVRDPDRVVRMAKIVWRKRAEVWSSRCDLCAPQSGPHPSPTSVFRYLPRDWSAAELDRVIPNGLFSLPFLQPVVERVGVRRHAHRVAAVRRTPGGNPTTTTSATQR